MHMWTSSIICKTAGEANLMRRKNFSASLACTSLGKFSHDRFPSPPQRSSGCTASVRRQEYEQKKTCTCGCVSFELKSLQHVSSNSRFWKWHYVLVWHFLFCTKKRRLYWSHFSDVIINSKFICDLILARPASYEISQNKCQKIDNWNCDSGAILSVNYIKRNLIFGADHEMRRMDSQLEGVWPHIVDSEYMPIPEPVDSEYILEKIDSQYLLSELDMRPAWALSLLRKVAANLL